MRSILSLPLAALATFALLAVPAHAQLGPPVCIHGGPYFGECSGILTPVPVDGSKCFDPDGTPITLLWFEECPFGFFDDPTSLTPNYILDMTGVCQRVCGFELEVSSGGQTTKCGSLVTVTDTMPPAIACPGDVVEIFTTGYPTQTSPDKTGFAMASDCDPVPDVGYSDVNVANTMKGEPELVVTRTWTATDLCQQQSSCVQTITLLSPSLNPEGAFIDLLPRECPNEVDVSRESGLFEVTLFGTAPFPISQVEPSSLRLARMDNRGKAVTRFAAKLADMGTPAGGAPCDCDGPAPDGKLDLALSFALSSVIRDLELDREVPGTSLELALVGRRITGEWFVIRDCLTVR